MPRLKKNKHKKGKVFLIGAGPGDPDLITVKGQKILKTADVVIHDHLISKELINKVKDDAKIIKVGNPHCKKHRLKQNEIKKLILKHALDGKNVVRLKGGDPFIFARGAEEIIYLKKHKIIAEVVPGISSISGVPTYAGIPLTHRGIASSFAVLTGHHQGRNQTILVPEVDTLVYLMCVANIVSIVREIRKCRPKSHIPCAIIEYGTTEKQRIVRGSTDNIINKIKKARIKPPAVFVVGDVVGLMKK